MKYEVLSIKYEIAPLTGVETNENVHPAFWGAVLRPKTFLVTAFRLNPCSRAWFLPRPLFWCAAHVRKATPVPCRVVNFALVADCVPNLLSHPGACGLGGNPSPRSCTHTRGGVAAPRSALCELAGGLA